MRRRLAVGLLALAALAGTLAACETPEPASGPIPSTDLRFGTHGSGRLDVFDVPLPDGRTVTCIVANTRGASCDWNTAE